MKKKLLVALAICLTCFLSIFLTKESKVSAAPSKTIPLDCLGDISIVGSYAYITSSCYNEIVVIDLTDPIHPQAINSFNVGFGADQIVANGTIALAADWGQMAVIDVTDPINLRKIGSLTTDIGSMVFKGNYAYLVTSNFSAEHYLKVVDLQNPSKPTLVNQVPLQDYLWGIDQAGNYLYVGSRGFTGPKLSIYNLTNPALPQLAGSYSGLYGCLDPKVENNYVYCDSGHDINVFDISNPANPLWLQLFGFTDFYPTYFSVRNHVVFAYDQSVGGVPNYLKIFEYLPANNTWNNWSSLTMGSIFHLALTGSYAYATVEKGLAVVDISNLSNPRIVYTLTNTYPLFTKYVDVDEASSGGILTYDIYYDNGENVVNNVRIEDMIPTGTTYVSGSGILDGKTLTDQQDSDEYYYDSVNKKAIWNIASMAVQASGYATFQVTVN